MKVLLHLCLAAGDLILYTGVLRHLKVEYPDVEFDFLCRRIHASILENNPNLKNLLILEDYDSPWNGTESIPSQDAYYNEWIEKTFKGKYDKLIHCLFSFPLISIPDLSPSKNIIRLVGNHGFPIKASEEEMNPIFYYDREDYVKADELYKKIKNSVAGDFSICLFEDRAHTLFNPYQEATNGILKTWMRKGRVNKELKNKRKYVSVGNNLNNDFLLKDLEIKQIKLFFEKYCDYFFGMTSGISCALTAFPSELINKKAIVCFPKISWITSSRMSIDLSGYYPYQSSSFTTKWDHYSLKDCFELLCDP